MEKSSDIEADKALIEAYGGPTKVAEQLGFDKARGGVQRVQNWTTRGIPARQKLKYPELFLRPAGELLLLKVKEG
ncbi:hypothetical protein [Rugamonas sp. DEMB1]|uniref:hypothetical protein n=1 Tax=Rugamonas sp. DEMB1 TaxID=3039386 RepID=UPI002447222A|nr:hypothetical protein [Rugamonas sp. DEMB1]WGG51809.1 hypothetical protein QC826_06200 [Rugamonas sp. DEMB1]